MPAPIIPDEEARQTCLGELRQIRDALKRNPDRLQGFHTLALLSLKRLANALNMKDVGAEAEAIVTFGGEE